MLEILEIPERVEFPEQPSSCSTLSPSGAVKIVVEGQEFEIAHSSTVSLALGKLRRVEDGSYTFPIEWDVRSSQFSTLIDFLQSTK